VWLAFGVALVPLVWILATVTTRGFSLLTDLDWWFFSHGGSPPGRLAVVPTTPCRNPVPGCGLRCHLGPDRGVTAIYLVEYGRGAFAKAVSFMVDILTGIPSIVAALLSTRCGLPPSVSSGLDSRCRRHWCC
jgi:phosphate transport system permease protein